MGEHKSPIQCYFYSKNSDQRPYNFRSLIARNSEYREKKFRIAYGKKIRSAEIPAKRAIFFSYDN